MESAPKQGRLVKGSEAAREYMKKLRELRKIKASTTEVLSPVPEPVKRVRKPKVTKDMC